MTAKIMRKELRTIIDTMPDRYLKAIMPLVTCIAEDYWKPVIEPANMEEISMIDERMKDYETAPASWMPLDSIN
jgi:hypothetical protein